jgi:hypothetical protein
MEAVDEYRAALKQRPLRTNWRGYWTVNGCGCFDPEHVVRDVIDSPTISVLTDAGR